MDYEVASPNRVIELTVDQKGKLWIGDDSGNIVRRDLAPGLNGRSKDESVHWKYDAPIWAINSDSEGYVWIGTLGQGLFVYNSSVDRLSEESGISPVSLELPSDSITTLLAGDDGKLWIGFFGDGMVVVDHTNEIRRFIYEAGNNYGLLNDQVFDIYRDRTGVVWVGSWDGLSRLSPHYEAFQLYIRSNEPGGLTDPRVVAFEEESPGKFWMGTYGGGLFFFDEEQEAFYSICTYW